MLWLVAGLLRSSKTIDYFEKEQRMKTVIIWQGQRPVRLCRAIYRRLYVILQLIYNCSLRTFTLDDGTITRFSLEVSGIGLTIHFQLMRPFLSKVQVPPPRLQISIRQ
jgi:hypothetical protein